MKTYVILGQPVPLSRPRLSHRAVYDPQKNLKLLTGITIESQKGDDPILLGALRFDVTFYMKSPISNRKKTDGQYHSKKSDLDNLVKYVLDACNTILYKDDGQIAEIHAKKLYSSEPRTEFVLTQL